MTFSIERSMVIAIQVPRCWSSFNVILSKEMTRRKISAGRVSALLATVLLLNGAANPALLSPPGAALYSENGSEKAPPVLGADLVYADWPQPLIDAWLDPEKGDQMARAFEAAGLRSLRFSFHGFYSPLGPEATAKV